MQTPVVFCNRKGERLFGIVHEPEPGPVQDLAIILLSPGVKMRVGPQRLYRGMGEEYARLGIRVLRFDFYGLGDSEGELQEGHLRDVYNHIEVGRFVDDTLDAMGWMEATYGQRRFILSGLCGGAVTGLLAGQDPRVAGLLALGITPVLASRSADPSLYMTSGELALMRSSYFTKLVSLKAWLRLVSLQSDYKVIWRAIVDGMKGGAKTSGESAATPENDNASPLFPPAFFAMAAAHRPMLLVFGGSDRLESEFQEKFVARHRQRLAQVPDSYEVHVIPHANHTLSLVEWQAEMLDVSVRWLRHHYLSDPSVLPRS